MSDVTDNPKPSRATVETVDERFSENRIKFAIIINILLEKEQSKIELGEINEETFKNLERLMDLDHQNRMKTANAVAGGRNQQILKDKQIVDKLKKIRDRDADNFPAKGPKGAREPVAEPDEG